MPPPPLKSFLANERTYLEWVDMSITLGAVAATLLSVQNVGYLSGASANAIHAAHILGFALMPSAVAFALFSGYLYLARRRILQAMDVGSPDLQTHRAPLVLGLLLTASLTGVFLINVFVTVGL